MANQARQIELAQQMLTKARQDLQASAQLMLNEQISNEIIGFHVQQTIEKALKAILIKHGVEYDFTHDLAVLFRQVVKQGFFAPATLEDIATLTPFAVQFRYGLLTDDEDFDRKTAHQLGSRFVQWAEHIINVPDSKE